MLKETLFLKNTRLDIFRQILPIYRDSPFFFSFQSVVFWVEGVGLALCGSAGIVGNVLTCVVLAKISLNNVFNQVRNENVI